MQNMTIPKIGHGINNRIHSSDKWAVFFIFLYWILYEHIVFFNASEVGPSMAALTVALKLLLPIGLLAYSGVPIKLIKNNYVVWYLVIFIVFLAWIGLVTLFNGDMIEWFKLLPRFVFFIAVLSIFYKAPAAFYLHAKLLISYVIFALLQYVLTYATESYNDPIIVTYESSGLMGLYSNIASRMYFPSFSIPILRLCGFWNEPSNASGSAFAAFFLARLLYEKEGMKKWKYASYACLLAGLLCLSNVGYFAFGMALGAGVLLNRGAGFRPARFIYVAIVLIVAIFAIWLTFFGRAYVQENYVDNDILRAIVGLRELNIDGAHNERFAIMDDTVNRVLDNAFGEGLTVIETKDVMVSASAVIYWFMVGGFLGLVLLLFREIVLACACYKLAETNTEYRYLIQALVVVMSQHLSYGSWMNPNYFFLAAAVISIAAKGKNQQISTRQFS